MSGIVLHTSTSTTHATNLAKNLSYFACELPFKGESPPALFGINVAILILGPAFLTKDVEDDPLLDEILAKSTDENFRLIPILLAECAWEESNYSGLHVLPRSKVPVLSSHDVREHLQSMEVISIQIREIEDSIHLKKENPIAYAKQQRKIAKQEKGASFWVIATKLGWKVLPYKTKWLLRIGLGGAITAISYLLLG